jgi:hypothetical protein
MPEHVHLLLSEPQRGTLADALKSLKQGVARRLLRTSPLKPKTGLSGPPSEHFWQKRYHDFNIRNYPQFVEKLRYIHRNPVKAGLCERPEDWQWSSFRTTQPAVRDGWRSNRNGRHANANERREDFVQLSNCPTQAKSGLEWASRRRGVRISEISFKSASNRDHGSILLAHVRGECLEHHFPRPGAGLLVGVGHALGEGSLENVVRLIAGLLALASFDGACELIG